MVSDLIFSYTGWFFILPVPAFAFCDLDGVAGALANEHWGKKVIEYLSILHTPGNQVSCLLLERAHIFPSLPFITSVPVEAFFLAMARFNCIRAAYILLSTYLHLFSFPLPRSLSPLLPDSSLINVTIMYIWFCCCFFTAALTFKCLGDQWPVYCRVIREKNLCQDMRWYQRCCETCRDFYAQKMQQKSWPLSVWLALSSLQSYYL